MQDMAIGNHLRMFVEEELFEAIALAVCGKCDVESCKDCEGTLILGEMETQIAEAGVALMRQLISDWGEQ